MSISGLDLLFLEVNNLEESLQFYGDQLGFEINKHTPDSEPPMATLQGGTLKITLAQHLETMLRRGRGVNFFLGVDDVDKYYRDLSDRGVEVHPPTDEGWGGRFITVQDPDKYRLFFVSWLDEKLESTSFEGKDLPPARD
ncbi:MAG: VOC family protein [Acidobacteriota bacterium]|nr:VOC family protein [Acidobacteriota bacterium]